MRDAIKSLAASRKFLVYMSALVPAVVLVALGKLHIDKMIELVEVLTSVLMGAVAYEGPKKVGDGS